MRILRVIPSMDPKQGGPCQGIRNSIPAQKKLGIENEVLSFDAPESEFINNENFQIHAIGPSRGPYSFCPKLKPWLESNMERFDVIIVHGLWQYTSYGTFKIWKNLKLKDHKVPRFYVMPHGMLDPYFQRAKSRRLKAIRNWFFWKLVEGKVVNRVDGVLFTCEEELLLARETFTPYKPKAEINVGYGIQLPPLFRHDFKNAFLGKCSKLENKPYWLFLSRIHPKKGVDLLLNAYLRLEKMNKNIPALVIAGPGLETAYGQELQKKANESLVYFPGMLDVAKKWGAFYGCQAFILPSHQENFGIAVVEAMACKKPVLISNQVNIWREIKNGKGGVIYADTEKGMYETLKKWLNKSEFEQQEMGENAAKIFEENYTNEKAAIKMVACIQ